MFCKLYFFLNNKNILDSLEAHLKNISEPYRIITNSSEVSEFCKMNGKKSTILDHVIQDSGQSLNEIYVDTKQSQEKNLSYLQKIVFRDFNIFNSFKFSLIQQLFLFTKIKKVLEFKENTIFVFSGYFVIYFATMKLASKLGYSDLEMAHLDGNKIEQIKLEDTDTTYDLQNKFSRQRFFNFLKSTFVNKLSLNKLKMIVRFAIRISSFLLKSIIFRFLSIANIDPTNMILAKIDRKIQSTNSKYNAECAFFITAVRDDLYLKPWYNIFTKFKQENTPYQIFTSDLATSLVLSKENISFINLFEEVNILKKEIVRTKEGEKIYNEIKQIFDKNDTVFGTTQLLEHILSQTFRAVAVTIICDHIIKKMKLKSIITSSDGEMLESLSVEVARKYNIPSFSSWSVITTPRTYFYDWFHADKIFVHGSEGFKFLTDFGYNKNRIIITGNPKFDFLENIESEKSKITLEENHNIDRQKKLVVIGMSLWRKNDELWMSDLIKFCNSNNFEIIIKIHPAYKMTSYEISENKIKTIKKSCENCKYLITYDTDLYTLLSAADLIITDTSNVGIEATLLGKPVLTVNILKESWNETDLFLNKNGGSIYIDEYSNLEQTIRDILIKKIHLEKLEEGRGIIMDMCNYYNDGKATDRIFKYLINPHHEN